MLPHFQKLHAIGKSKREDAPLLYFGRLSAEKGVDDLLRSMQKGFPHMRLVVAGDDPQRAELQGLAASLGLSNVVGGHVGREERDLLISSHSSRFCLLTRTRL